MSHYLTLAVNAVKFKPTLKNPKTRASSLKFLRLSSLILFSFGLGYVFYFVNRLYWDNDPDVRRLALNSIKIHLLSNALIAAITIIMFVIQLFQSGVFSS